MGGFNVKTKTIKIFHTSDTHGNITNQSFINKSISQFSLSKVASYIRKNTDNNTLIIDTGDTIQGCPLTYYLKDNYSKYNNPISNIFNYIGYDYFIPGNHDFNYGLDYLQNFTNNLNATTLSCNILTKNDVSFFNKKYDIKIINDIKIAIVGATTDYINKWENPKNINGLNISDTYIAIKKSVQEIKELHKPDLIILAYHGGIESDFSTNIYTDKNVGENIGYKIFTEVKDIDIILAGHQHRLINYKHNNRVLVMPGSKGQILSEIIVSFDDEGKKITSQLINVDNESHDQKIIEKNSLIIKDSEVFFDQIIGYNKRNDLLITNQLDARLNKHKIVTLINNIQLKTTKADISATSLANNAFGFNKEITIRDVLNTYVYPNTLVVVEINGITLKNVLEQYATFFIINNDLITINEKYIKPKLELYNYVMFEGISYVINVSKPLGKKVSNLRFGENTIKDKDVFKLVINNYRASGAGNENIYEHLKVIKEYPLDISELLIDYIKANKNIDVISTNNITIEK